MTGKGLFCLLDQREKCSLNRILATPLVISYQKLSNVWRFHVLCQLNMMKKKSPRRIVAKVTALWKLQSPPFHFADAPQSASGEELSALMPSILDKAFKGELSCHCEERSLRRGNPLFEEIASLFVLDQQRRIVAHLDGLAPIELLRDRQA